ncbi:MAG: hypothetical protein KDB27_22175 [Planctomycetales bacterium]|nr:hypothetical protein [Planctomycetales bacterium]
MTKRRRILAVLFLVTVVVCLVVFTRKTPPPLVPTPLVNPPQSPEQLVARIEQNQSRLRNAFLSRPGEKLAGVGIRSITGRWFNVHSMHQYSDIMYFDSVAEALGGDAQESQGLGVSLMPRVDIGCGCCFEDVPANLSVISDQDLALMALVDDVRWLSVCYPNISGAGLACFAQKDDLEWLYVANCNLVDNDLRGVAMLESVRHLDLSKNAITGPGLRYLASLKYLETLHLSRNRLDSDALKYMPALPNLRVLYIDNTAIDGAGITNLEKLPQLEELSLQQTHINDDNFAQLGSLQKLQRLNLGQTYVADDAMAAVARQSNLQSLDLSNSYVRGAGLQHLLALKKLDSLNLTGCNLYDRDLELAKPLLRTANLVFHNTNITSAGIIKLADDSVGYIDQLADQRSPATLSAADANHISERLPSLTALHIRILPSDEPIDLRFSNMNQLRSLSVSLPHVIDSITLENLPALTEFRVLSLEQDRRAPSPIAQIVRLRQLPNLGELKCGVSTELEIDESIQLGYADLTLRDLADAGVLLNAKTRGLKLRSDESLNAERLVGLLKRAESTALSIEVPEFSRAMSSVITDLLPDLEGFYLRTERFTSDAPFAFASLLKLEDMALVDVEAERLEFNAADLPLKLSKMELENVSVGGMYFDGCHCRLRIKSARRFDSLHISNVDAAVAEHSVIGLFTRFGPANSDSVRHAPRDVYLNDLFGPSKLRTVYLQYGDDVENVIVRLSSFPDVGWDPVQSVIWTYQEIDRPTPDGVETIRVPKDVVGQLDRISPTTAVKIEHLSD